MKQKSRIDWWIGVLLWGVLLAMVPSFLLVEQQELIYVLFSFLVIALVILPFIFNTYYELKQDHLHIKVGFVKQRIYYENIKSLKLCTNLISSMALSSKRIEIKELKKDSVLGTTYISPIDRELFLNELKKHCYNIERDN